MYIIGYIIQDRKIFSLLIELLFNDFQYLNIEDSSSYFNSILFLKKYIKYLNIQYDNKNNKIDDIEFKTNDIKKKFDEKYLETLNYIKLKENHKFKNFKKRMDNLELERLIISIVLKDKQKNFKSS